MGNKITDRQIRSLDHRQRFGIFILQPDQQGVARYPVVTERWNRPSSASHRPDGGEQALHTRGSIGIRPPSVGSTHQRKVRAVNREDMRVTDTSIDNSYLKFSFI